MDLPIHLAMTAGEFSACREVPEKSGWMSCHFSSYTPGLSGLPPALPEGSILILDDAVPMADHHIPTIKNTLLQFINRNPVSGLLLDLQRPPQSQTVQLVRELCQMPCPVAMPPTYGKDLPCGVFLPPCPTYISAEKYLQEWHGREIWLEAACNAHTLLLTENGCTVSDGIPDRVLPYREETLFCHYDMQLEKDRAYFYLQRTREDLFDFLAAAEKLDVCRFVGLYQELGK